MLRCTRAQELGGVEAGAEFFRQKFRKGYCEVLKFRLSQAGKAVSFPAEGPSCDKALQWDEFGVFPEQQESQRLWREAKK